MRVDELEERVDELERRAKESERRAEESQRRAEQLERRAKQSERRAEESERRAEESERRAGESERRAEVFETRAEESERRAEESQRRAERLERRAESRAEESERRAEESENRAEESEMRAEESERRAEESEKRAEESERRAGELESRAEEFETRAEESERRAEESQRRAERLERRAESRAEESERRAEESENRAEESEMRAEESERRAEESESRAEESEMRAEESERRAEESERRAEESERRAGELESRAEEFETRAEESERREELLRNEKKREQDRVVEVETVLNDTRRRLREYENSQWAVGRDDIELTGPELGRGAWATVSVAKFRGLKVAAKIMHDLLISESNEELFRREMSIASRLHHPNLVLFIGATIVGDMIILMEFVSTNLRKQLERDRYFQPNTAQFVILDVCTALTYLHNISPVPIVHRDISSSNILLEPQLPPKFWKAKVTDYGTVNLINQIHTMNPGSPAYCAPESCDPCLQSPKMDIYSLGALLLEMLTGKLPAPDDRPTLLLRVHHDPLKELIMRCLSERREDRPTARDIITELQQHED